MLPTLKWVLAVRGTFHDVGPRGLVLSSVSPLRCGRATKSIRVCTRMPRISPGTPTTRESHLKFTRSEAMTELPVVAARDMAYPESGRSETQDPSFRIFYNIGSDHSAYTFSIGPRRHSGSPTGASYQEHFSKSKTSFNTSTLPRRGRIIRCKCLCDGQANRFNCTPINIVRTSEIVT